MYCRTYNVKQENQQRQLDYAIIPESEVHRFFQYHDECDYRCLSFGSFDRKYNLSCVPEAMRYYIETKKGILLFFRQEKNMWKWLYEHHDDFQIEAYGKYNI